jgi:hypothetical protein
MKRAIDFYECYVFMMDDAIYTKNGFVVNLLCKNDMPS